MPLTGEEIRANLTRFVARWSVRDGYERGEAQTFLTELFDCYGQRLSDAAESQGGRSGDRETMADVMSHDANIDPATERVLDGIENEELAARYPNRAHFISADNPHQGEMATRALFEGDPVVIVYPDGHELLVQPEQARGFARWSRVAAALLLRFRRLDRGTVQLPPRAHIEARDSGGHPIAA